MLACDLFVDVNLIKMHLEFAEIIERKNFVNMDISLNIPYKALKFGICIQSYKVLYLFFHL